MTPLQYTHFLKNVLEVTRQTQLDVEKTHNVLEVLKYLVKEEKNENNVFVSWFKEFVEKNNPNQLNEEDVIMIKSKIDEALNDSNKKVIKKMI